MLNPPITGNNDLDSWLYNLNIEAASGFGGTSIRPVDPTTGAPVSYPFQFIHVKYADDNVGTGITNVPANKIYWGIFNSALSIESNNPADYTWYESQSGFGTVTYLYYQIIGGRQVKFSVTTTQPSYKWLVDAGLAIDLDSIVPAATITFNELMDSAVTELKIAASAVTATKINVAALDQSLGNLRANTVSAAQIATDAVTELKILNGSITNNKLLTGTITGDKIFANTITGNKIAAETIGAGSIAAGAITTTKLEAGAVTTAKIEAGAVTSAKITVNDLSAISANMGSITAGSLNAVNITGSTITGNTINGGTINGTSGTFSGNLSAAGGTFNGNLSAAGGTFSGSLSAASGTFSGALTSSAINAVNTINLAGNAVTIASAVTGNATGVTLTTSLVGSQPVYIHAIADQAAVSTSQAYRYAYLEVSFNGSSFTTIKSASNLNPIGIYSGYFFLQISCIAVYVPSSSGNYTFRFSATGGNADASVYVVQTKR